MRVETRSSSECAASAINPRLPVNTPTVNFTTAKPLLAITDHVAIFCFSLLSLGVSATKFWLALSIFAGHRFSDAAGARVLHTTGPGARREKGRSAAGGSRAFARSATPLGRRGTRTEVILRQKA